ncbi:hypothetical protein [Magnetospira sp. QH-2]|uniref:hypothetical protein n=1 Tax=Magnetospira sp. (strain QH-2) TaxID=1288970 RepID=UPI0003E81697|nr:hypothetical protein [Magnetospira sp. QH-2]CCQ75039.1 protein of unknown function [Magnetospira sp. QH-2]
MDPVTRSLDDALKGLDSAKSTAGTRARGYDQARDVENRARSFNQETSEQEKHAFLRLDRVLNSGEALREDVPRGYYLNLLV